MKYPLPLGVVFLLCPCSLPGLVDEGSSVKSRGFLFACESSLLYGSLESLTSFLGMMSKKSFNRAQLSSLPPQRSSAIGMERWDAVRFVDLFGSDRYAFKCR